MRARIAALEARFLVPARQLDEAPPSKAFGRQERVAPWRREVTGLVGVFMLTRVVLVVIGLVSRDLTPGPVVHPQPLGIGPSYSSVPFLDLWGQWDSSWYLSIAEDGYKPFPLEGPFPNYAFFPLYPFLARAVGWLVGGPFIGGLVVSNVAFLVACVFLYRLVALDDDVATARRAVKYLIAAPAAFLFSAMLSESLFLALAVTCFYYARTKQWWAVGVLGFFLALSRAPGILVAFPLLWMYLEQRGRSLRRVGPEVLWLAGFPAGLFVFMGINEALTGDGLAFTRIQVTAWGHRLQDPLSAVWHNLTGENPVWRFNGWYLIVVLALTLLFAKRFGVTYLLFLLVSVLPPMSYGVWYSMVRYTVVIFPLYVVAARVTASRPIADQALTVTLALLQGFLMTHWANNGSLVI
ncbi:MAG: hypothetical protein M3N28_07635 [Actinomycetota bacterium]|nr:hypothetical protein [Actinomycetota bacterium]